MTITAEPTREGVLRALRSDTEGSLQLLAWIAGRLGAHPVHGSDELMDVNNAIAEFLPTVGLPTTAVEDDSEEQAYWERVF